MTEIPPTESSLTDDEYRSLAAFRRALRRFLSFSERAAREHGLTPSQHQLLLAIRGHPGAGPPSTSDLAEALQLKLHSVGELADRAVEKGLVQRHHDPADVRRSLLELTPDGLIELDALSVLHRRELRRFRGEFGALLDGLGDEP